jgi:bacteriocin-like protein
MGGTTKKISPKNDKARSKPRGSKDDRKRNADLTETELAKVSGGVSITNHDGKKL